MVSADGRTLSAMGWDAWTAIGTLALAVMTLTAVIVTIVVTTQDRRRADERARRERLWSDAEVVADIEQLLVDTDPVRRGANASASPAEDEMWAGLARSAGRSEGRLHVLAIGHPSENVREMAKSLPRVVWSAYVASRMHVSEVLRPSQGSGEAFSDAQARHRDALDALGTLEAAITSAARADGRKWRRQRGRGG
jgi:hypothetical protein